ncbi:glucose-6-phosphate 1-dehydrogenase [Trypanosoma conorhini]|uniref:glucose-6-phosphate dehydrogenase (NADP(+)) n=1 Tax=Trypanosoma conorhini TaxID=83891 RepID=A0A422NHS1_9TRYP|nr:glucose-6-phosphate 1-dehydrogenase [Trypanosoma conorhini]RNF05001.1 glucose-6-phosphate 1-dehydrogenase [Trypanosoma conorhini]
MRRYARWSTPSKGRSRAETVSSTWPCHPPSSRTRAEASTKGRCSGPGPGWVRLIVEKPFGKDTGTSQQPSRQLEPLFDESQLFRFGYRLGKEMVQNIVVTRFANRVFRAPWISNITACVRITLKETIGTAGRGGCFDSIGIMHAVAQKPPHADLFFIDRGKSRAP